MINLTEWLNKIFDYTEIMRQFEQLLEQGELTGEEKEFIMGLEKQYLTPVIQLSNHNLEEIVKKICGLIYDTYIYLCVGKKLTQQQFDKRILIIRSFRDFVHAQYMRSNYGNEAKYLFGSMEARVTSTPQFSSGIKFPGQKIIQR